MFPIFVTSAALTVASAQTYSPKAILFEGVPQYRQADLLRVSGLKPGVPETSGDIAAALQRLADTGLFAEYKYTVSPAELRVQLTPAAASAVLPVRYGNLVWWKPAELTELLQQRVPLFTGSVPNDGSLQASVRTALLALLTEKGFAAPAVTMHTSEDTQGGPVTAVTYWVTSPAVRVGAVYFDGASPQQTPELDQLGTRLAEQEYDEINTPKALVQGAETIYRNDGYLDMRADPPVAGAPRKLDAEQWIVDFRTNVHEGALYRVASVTVNAAPPLTTDALTRSVGVKAGDPASAAALRRATTALAGPYRSSGYLGTQVVPSVAKDGAAHTVAYTFAITPGEIYHIAAIKTAGMSPEQTQACMRALGGLVGAPFDQTFTRKTLDMQRDGLFSRTGVQTSAQLDHAAHTVTVTLSPGHAQLKS